LEYPNAKTVGNRDIQLVLAEFKELNMLSVIVHTNLNIIIILHGVGRLTIKLTLLG